jgi:SPOR domain
MFMPPPSAADRVVTAEMPALTPTPVTAFPPPSPAQRVGVYAFPPPLAEHRIPETLRRRGWRRVVVIDRGPPWLGPALLAAVGVLLIGAGIGLGAHAIFGGKSHKKNNAPSAVATPGQRQRVTPLTPSNPSTATPTPTGPATVSPGASSQGKSAGKSQRAPATPVAPGGGSQTTGGGIASWPSGKTAWTVILASTGNKSAAESKARQASGRGIQAGVLNSNDYSSLRHGYWVAFAGQYGSSGEAASAAKRYASQGFAGSYARFVKP